MSKRKQVAQGPPATGSTEVGKLLSELFDPRYQAFMQMEASESDVLEFLEASRQLFAYKPNRSARRFLRMPIDTPSAAQQFTTALIRKINEIRQKGNPGDDAVQFHRLQLARLIDDTLTRRNSKAILIKWTRKIWAEAKKLAQVRPGGATRGRKLDWKKQKWARFRVVSILKAKPGISISTLAEELQRQARKEDLRYWLNR